MEKYVTQELFNMCAVSAAKIAASSEYGVDEAASMICGYYEEAYQDTNLEEDVVIAAEKLGEFLSGTFDSDSMAGAFHQLQFCIKHYKLDGKKKWRKLFGGTMFSYEKSQIPDKVDKCLTNIATYHLLVMAGRIPIVPKGWSL